MIRKIIRINEDLCNGCGACANACHEGAIAMVNGKAKLIRDDYCDGLGNCLPACPTGAISFEEREAAAYDEAAVARHMEARKQEQQAQHAGGCPGSRIRQFNMDGGSRAETAAPGIVPSQLRQWPVQIKLARSTRRILTGQTCSSRRTARPMPMATSIRISFAAA